MRRAGSRIAEVALPDDIGAHLARTGRTPGHVTVWAPREELLARAMVVACRPASAYPPPMLYVLVDDHGTPLGEFDDRAAAIRALDELIAADPTAAENCGITVFDHEGRRVGDPISRSAAA